VPVEVRSAVALDEQTLADIAERLKGQGVPKARFSTRVEPDLIGGLVLRIGDKLYDGSVRTRLRRLKHRLAQA
jgi:F-type H+-transporting ATPase subunit delta